MAKREGGHRPGGIGSAKNADREQRVRAARQRDCRPASKNSEFLLGWIRGEEEELFKLREQVRMLSKDSYRNDLVRGAWVAYIEDVFQIAEKGNLVRIGFGKTGETFRRGG